VSYDHFLSRYKCDYPGINEVIPVENSLYWYIRSIPVQIDYTGTKRSDLAEEGLCQYQLSFPAPVQMCSRIGGKARQTGSLGVLQQKMLAILTLFVICSESDRGQYAWVKRSVFV
jgi:hypothetical protein